MAAQPWMDLTFRPASGSQEVEVEPDGTVEVAFRGGSAGSSSVTLLLTVDEFRTIIARGLELSALGKLPQTNHAQPGE